MNTSCSKKKEKVDLSKLSAMELLLIGESQTLASQPCSSKSIRAVSQGSSGYAEGDDEKEVGEMDSEEDDDDDSGQSSGSDSDDWEEVSDRHVEAELQKYAKTNGDSTGKEQSQLSTIPDEGLEIVIPSQGVFRKDKKGRTIEDILNREMNKDRLELQEHLHKVSVLFQLARGLRLNAIVNSELIRDSIKERLKGQTFSEKRFDLAKLETFIKWFRFNVIITKPSITGNLEVSSKDLSDEECLAYQIIEKTAIDANWNVLIFVAFLRYLKIDVRLVISVNAIPLRPPAAELFRKRKNKEDEDADEDCEDEKKSTKKGKEKKEKSKRSREKKEKSKRSREMKPKAEKTADRKRPSGKNTGRKIVSSSEDEDYEDEKSKEKNLKEGGKRMKKDEKAMIGQDMWAEVYLVDEERWASVDILTGKLICDKQLEMEATRPLTYVLGFDGKNTIRDVTRRYASGWLTGDQRRRVKSDWWDKTLKPYRGRWTARDKEEDEFLDQHLLSLPIPKYMSEFKGHPLFVLRRHLLKFEGLYPENPPSLAFIKSEPVYSRDNVHALHTREVWLREAKVVRIGEKPYKIVKARPKYDKLTGARLPDTSSELFGPWQTEDYIPPIAQNGKVPRNEYGNVELFTEKLLPQGCVHLRLAGLQRIANKLDIDCAAAVVGFDFGSGATRPTFDGFVVCEEFEGILMDAWNGEQEQKKKKDEEKRLQRIYGNWRRLIRGAMIRARLEKKYSVNLSGKRKSETGPVPSSSSSKRSRKK